MRIVSDQLIAGYPAIEVRDFVKRYRFTGFFTEAAEFDLALRPKAAVVFLNKLVNLGFIRGTGKSNGRKSFELTSNGQALANASAARPIHRRTAERVLAQFLERVHRVNCTQVSRREGAAKSHVVGILGKDWKRHAIVARSRGDKRDTETAGRTSGIGLARKWAGIRELLTVWDEPEKAVSQMAELLS